MLLSKEAMNWYGMGWMGWRVGDVDGGGGGEGGGGGGRTVWAMGKCCTKLWRGKILMRTNSSLSRHKLTF